MLQRGVRAGLAEGIDLLHPELQQKISLLSKKMHKFRVEVGSIDGTSPLNQSQ